MKKPFSLMAMALALVLILSMVPPATAVGVEDEANYYGCFESQELADAFEGALIRKNVRETPGIYSARPYPVDPGLQHFTLMPSIGNVNMLVLPIAYSDHADILENYYDEETYKTKVFFNEYDPTLELNAQSVRGYYQWASNGKLDITGTILPVYTAPDTGTYYEKNPSQFSIMIGDALEYYADNGFDFSKFDNNGDGVLDALVVHSLAFEPYKPEGNSSVWQNVIRTLLDRKIGNYSVNSFAHVTRAKGTLQNVRAVFCHEIAHLLGMHDHYHAVTSRLDYSLNELMTGSGGHRNYINAYYRTLLGWIDPVILTNEDEVQTVELAPVDKYFNEIEGKETAVVLIPEATNFPFTEFYIAEYRAGETGDPSSTSIFDRSPGIVIWHCDTYYDSTRKDKQYYEALKFLKPVFKSGTETYGEKDIYIAGDEFSSDTEVNSNFYNGQYTGAYLKVEQITREKAVLLAGIREPDLRPGPTISITGPSVPAIRTGEKASFTVTVTSDSQIIPASEYAREDLRYAFYTTGDLTGSGLIFFRPTTNNPMKIEYNSGDYREGEGTLWFDIPPGAIQYNGKDSNPVKSGILYVDNTPPEITLKGENPQLLQLGTTYGELGAVVTDNLDQDIGGKLEIDATQVNVNVPGEYTVTYSATDHAGHLATVERTVIIKDGPLHIHVYSEEWKSDETNHWHECECGAKTSLAAHRVAIAPAEEPTCTAPGKTAGSYCPDCGKVLQEQAVVSPKGHSYFTEWSSDENSHWHECSACQDKIDLAGHTEDTGTVTKEPTTEETGLKTYHCTVCGGVTRTEILDKLHIHDYSENWNSDLENHWHECTCGDRKDQAPHVPEVIPGQEPTCTSSGMTKGSRCSVCGRILVAQQPITAKGHNCSAEWSRDDSGHWLECLTCHKKTNQGRHTEDAGTVTKQPTEQETGIKTYRCATCGYVMRTEVLDKLEPSHAHKYSTDWKSDETDHWHECACGDRKDRAGHVPEVIPGQAPTCAKEGKTEGSRCSVCGKILVAQREIPKENHEITDQWYYGTIYEGELGHWRECAKCKSLFDFGLHEEDDGTVTKAPTVEETGLKTYHCCACGYVMRTEVLGKLESSHVHEYPSNWKDDETNHWHECECGDKSDLAAHTPEKVPGRVPTCTEPGMTEGSRCSVCGRVLVEQVEISPKGHNYSTEWSSDENGHWHECDCGGKKDQAAHAWDGGVVTTAPTSSKVGVRTYSCTICGRTRTESIPATGGGGSGGGGGGGFVSTPAEYKITLPAKLEGGSVRADREKAEKGALVTLTVEPKEGYVLDTLSVKDKKGNEIPLEQKADGTYTFPMPGSDVEISTVFCEIPAEVEPTPPEEEKLPFSDVTENAWYYSSVKVAWEKGVMNGITTNRFDPDGLTSRGMVAAMLYRLEGQPPVLSIGGGFPDVSDNQYYATAIAWAANSGILLGFEDSTFRPDDPVTREQLVTILYRYAGKKGHNVSQRTSLDRFFDAEQISSYAEDAMAWATGSGLLTGADWGGIDPAGRANRAQVAAILERFSK